MKIMQIYSNKKNFKRVVFNDTFNVIIGRITHGMDLDKDSHNLGKTTLIDIIDFLLLKTIDKNHFLKKHDDIFNDYIFYIEIERNHGGYITLKRGVKNNTKISIKLHDKKHQNYINELDWDYEGLALTTKNENENPKHILNMLLEFDVLKSYDYRQTINYFLRTQGDYTDVFRLSKFKGKDIGWKPFLFELLGFDRKNVFKKYELEDKKVEQEEKIKNIRMEFSINIEEMDKINGLLQIKQNEKNEISERTDNFDFYFEEKGLEKKLVEDIETKISELNSIQYDLDYEISKIKESLTLDNNYDLNETIEIFKEAEIYFNEQLKRNYKELIEFNEKITNERKKYLNSILEEKETILSQVTDDLKLLNSKRMLTMKTLKECDTFEKYKKYQSELIALEKEIDRLNIRLENIDIIKKHQKQLEVIENDIKTHTELISAEVKKSTEFYKSVKIDYYNYLKSIINKPGILSIEINTNGNINFKAEIANYKNELTSEDRGHSYKKILCACFDIALLKNYINKSFFRFVYHDGCLESLDPRKQVQYLDLVRNISNQYNFQYILTALDSDIPVYNGIKYAIRPSEIALELSDDEDDKGRLFEISF